MPILTIYRCGTRADIERDELHGGWYALDRDQRRATNLYPSRVDVIVALETEPDPWVHELG